MPFTAGSTLVRYLATASLCGIVTLRPLMPNRGTSSMNWSEHVERHAERHIHRINLGGAERRIVNLRAEAVADRIGNHAIDGACRADAVVSVDIRSSARS